MSEAKDFADQILKYADGLVAAVFVQNLAFCYKLGEKEFRAGVSKIPAIMTRAILAGGAVYFVLLAVLQWLEHTIRCKSEFPHQRTILWFGRYSLLVLFTIVALWAYRITWRPHSEERDSD